MDRVAPGPTGVQNNNNNIMILFSARYGSPKGLRRRCYVFAVGKTYIHTLQETQVVRADGQPIACYSPATGRPFQPLCPILAMGRVLFFHLPSSSVWQCLRDSPFPGIPRFSFLLFRLVFHSCEAKIPVILHSVTVIPGYAAQIYIILPLRGLPISLADKHSVESGTAKVTKSSSPLYLFPWP
jgi:hypothetical protein